MNVFHKNITFFFNELIKDLDYPYDTKAYIVGIYDKYKSSTFDLSKDSITLLFAQARDKKDFFTYQNIGDWLFFINTISPNYSKNISKDYYDTIARLSYYSCYTLINKQWKLFEQLADDFIVLENLIQDKLKILHF